MYHRYAHAVLHQPANGIETAKLDTMPNPPVQLACMGFQIDLDRCPARISNEVMIQQRLERNVAQTFKTGSSCGHDRAQAVGRKRICLQCSNVRGSRHDTDIRDAVDQGLDNLGTQPLLHFYIDVRMISEEMAHRPRQEFSQRVGVREEPYRAPEPVRELAEVVVQALHGSERTASVAQQRTPCLCGQNTKPLAREQRHTNRLFHLLDASACGTECEVDARRPVRDAAGLHHRDEQPQVCYIETHGVSPLQGSVSRTAGTPDAYGKSERLGRFSHATRQPAFNKRLATRNA